MIAVVVLVASSAWLSYNISCCNHSDDQGGDALPGGDNSGSISTPAGIGVPVKTLIGTLLFDDTHEIGRLGDYLCHLYFQSSDTASIYTRMKSKWSKVHGLDAVYYRSPARGSDSVIVIENKVNGSRYKGRQLSDDKIRDQCYKLHDTRSSELAETASLVIGAMNGRDGLKLDRLLMEHDLIAGKTTRTRIASTGARIPFSRKTRDVSHRLRKILISRVDKGRYRRA